MIEAVTGPEPHDRPVHWREAMAAALYGPDGFFVRAGNRPGRHFRTSALASPRFAEAILRLLHRIDEALERPDPLMVVDLGAGGGELLAEIGATAPPSLAARLRPVAVELALAGPPGLVWTRTPPDRVTGMLLATEWLDNVPVDVAEVDGAGVARYVLVDPATGEETPGEPVRGPDAEWLARWWPLTVPGSRAEIGRTRDDAWAQAVATVHRGAALTVDYGHSANARPPLGTLTGFRDGREVPPVPDGSCDLTAHVAMDALAAAGSFALHTHTHHRPDGRVCVCSAKDHDNPALVQQAEALRALGVTGARPPLALAHRDPTAYLRGLAAAGDAAELTDPAGLGGHYWLLQPAGLHAGVAGWLA